MKTKMHTVQVVGSRVWSAEDDNVDVEVLFPDGRRFGATFFTLKNLEKLFEKNKKTGECADGLYLWAANMVLVRDLSMGAIERAVDDLIENNELEQAFAELRGGTLI
ncbi:MAG TPA: hypothetical protein VKE95_18960 [Burkholderiales bacterium]|nr:hypothetical protein [Burkholderiales bacterium]